MTRTCPRKPVEAVPGLSTAECELTEPRQFNLMFKTFMGPVEEQAAVVYLRPETAQGIYVNFLNVLQSVAAEDSLRHRADRQGVPERDHAGQLHLPDARVRADGDAVLREAGDRRGVVRAVARAADGVAPDRSALDPARLRWHQHGPDELAHYARAAFDIEYEFPFGWQEIEGIHNRTDFDLGRHQEYSGKKLEYFDQAANERYLPYVVETSAGADRVALTLLVDAYREEEVEGETRVVLGLHPAVAPIKVGVFPLVKKDGMPEVATRAVPRSPADAPRLLRRQRRDRPAVPPAGRGGHPLRASRSMGRHAGGPDA